MNWCRLLSLPAPREVFVAVLAGSDIWNVTNCEFIYGYLQQRTPKL
jgi:hypothetical protein